MRIECPTCNFSAEVSGEKVPPRGGTTKCPRCSAVFFFSPKAPLIPNDKLETVICPKCGTKQDAGETCAACGIFYKKYRQVEGGRIPSADITANTKTRSKRKFYIHVTFVLGCTSLILLLICALGEMVNSAYNSSDKDINFATKGWSIITPAIFMLYPLEVKYGKKFSLGLLLTYPIIIFTLKSQFFMLATLLYLGPLIIIPLCILFGQPESKGEL